MNESLVNGDNTGLSMSVVTATALFFPYLFLLQDISPSIYAIAYDCVDHIVIAFKHKSSTPATVGPQHFVDAIRSDCIMTFMPS